MKAMAAINANETANRRHADLDSTGAPSRSARKVRMRTESRIETAVTANQTAITRGLAGFARSM